MRLEELKQENIIFASISGSHAYGLNTATSDTDHRGVFIAPKELFYGMHCPDQVADDKSDTVYYELSRFIELITKQNPNIIELLGMPEDCVLSMHPLFDRILANKDKFITRRVRDTFGGYAIAQIGKARGMNKKIVKPFDKERKTPVDFCYVLFEGDAIPFNDFLANTGYKVEYFGLAAFAHGRDCYSMYYDHDRTIGFRGIVFEDSNDVHLSSIPKGMHSIGVLYYNKDAYTVYCREYKEYWDWVAKRNPARYEKNMEVGKGYDTKNMMHCIRLLRMAEEMLRGQGLNVRRPDRDELLDIRNGLRDYDELIAYAESKIALLDELVPVSPLPTEVDAELLNKLLIEIRDEYYATKRIG